ncbi:hypothetical protein PHMEG_00011561 [Phytophthora megakarya]|uniref:RxLR effector protein n=1 Tax=Phytophthora megakarya TaxID=4795 RepID=A0A225WAX9_9STRA|nr:hypothetical protein PHMEG_00011561 [Phytophthora megakarya]
MKFATGLVLAALAVTAVNAGNPKNLRSTVDDSASDDFDFSDSLDASGSDDFDEDDLMIDLTDLFGSDSDSDSGSHVKVNIMSLIGSGSDQVDLQDIIDAFGDEDSASGSDDLSWLLDSDSGSDDDDEILVKGGKEDPTLVKGATKGKTPVYEDDSDSGSDDLSWLDDSDSASDEEDPILVKGATKGKTPAVEEDPILVKGATKGKTPVYEDDSDSGSDDLSWLLDSDSDSASDEEDPILVKGATKGKTVEDPVLTKGKSPLYDDSEEDDDEVLVKGGNKSPATKTSKTEKAAKTSGSNMLLENLYDEGSEGTLGEEEDPILVKGATKGKTPVVDDASDEDDHLQTSQAEKTATKSSKTLW